MGTKPSRNQQHDDQSLWCATYQNNTSRAIKFISLSANPNIMFCFTDIDKRFNIHPIVLKGNYTSYTIALYNENNTLIKHMELNGCKMNETLLELLRHACETPLNEKRHKKEFIQMLSILLKRGADPNFRQSEMSIYEYALKLGEPLVIQLTENYGGKRVTKLSRVPSKLTTSDCQINDSALATSKITKITTESEDDHASFDLSTHSPLSTDATKQTETDYIQNICCEMIKIAKQSDMNETKLEDVRWKLAIWYDKTYTDAHGLTAYDYAIKSGNVTMKTILEEFDDNPKNETVMDSISVEDKSVINTDMDDEELALHIWFGPCIEDLDSASCIEHDTTIIDPSSRFQQLSKQLYLVERG